MTTNRFQPMGTLQQPSPFGSAMAAPLLIHRLFFAVFPDANAQRAIAGVAENLRTHHGVRGRWIDPSRYHLTLHFLGDQSEVGKDRVDRAATAAAKIALPEFEIVLDRLASFKGRQPPGVLCGGDGPQPVHALWQALRRELMLAGCEVSPDSKFIPHVTLFYSDGTAFEHQAIATIAWTAREFALVHSVVGQHDYRVLASWPVAG